MFVKLWINKNKIKIKHNVKSYLYTAVKNHSLNYIKQEKLFVSIDDDLKVAETQAVSPEEDLIKKNLYEAVHKAIGNLPDQCQRIYLMKKYDNLSYKEIAEILGISINTVKTQMKRALKSLFEKLAYLRVIIVFLV